MRGAGLVGATLVYGALALVAHRALLPGLGDRVYAQEIPGNDCLLHAWTLAWDQHALATQPGGLFDANIFFPHRRTLLYSDHLLGLAVPLAPLRLVTDDPVLVHNLVTLAAPALDALAMYALARSVTGDGAAALVGGLLYGFAPVRLEVDRCQLQMLAAWWLPLVFLFAWRAVSRDRPGAGVLAGVALALQGLSGIYLMAFGLPCLALAQLVWLRRFPFRVGRRGWWALLAGEVAAGLVLLPFLAAYRDVQRELGVSRSVVLDALLSLDVRTFAHQLPVWTLALLCAAGVLARRGVPQPFRTERALFAAIMIAGTLLALGPAVALPGGLGTVRGPYAALLHLPGYDALRAPGRFVHLALLAAAVLAAGGFATFAARLPRAARPALLAVAVGAVLLESWAPSFPTLDIPQPARMDPVYPWLAAQPDDLRYVELPVDYYLTASLYQYASTAHWRRTAGGNMGLLPPVYPVLVSALARFPDADVVGMLRGLGVTHAVVHQRGLDASTRTRLAALGGDPASQLGARFEGETSLVLDLRRAPTAPDLVLRGRPLARDAWRAEAGPEAVGADRAIDGDPRTAWSSWGGLEAALGRWYDPVPFRDRWRAFLAAQPAHLAVDLGTTATLTGVVVRLGGSDPLAAPEIRVETSLDGRDWTRLPALAPWPDVQALVREAAEAKFAAIPAAPLPARFVRLLASGLEVRVGDLDVYAR